MMSLCGPLTRKNDDAGRFQEPLKKSLMSLIGSRDPTQKMKSYFSLEFPGTLHTNELSRQLFPGTFRTNE